MSAPSFAAGPDPLHDSSELIQQVQDLQRRVLMLEQHLGNRIIGATSPDAAVIAPVPVSRTPARLDLAPNALPMLGTVLVAIAGAYVLRALTDFGVLPRTAGLAIGLIYAVAWLFIAARQPVEREFSTFLTCSTSMLIMAPLIWEASARLKAMSSWVSSAILVGFTFIGVAVSWRKDQIIISGVVSVSSTLIAAALLLATHDLLPFTLALLAIAAVTEFATCRDHQTFSRWLSAIAADAAVLVFSWLMSREKGLPEEYVPASARAALAAQLLLILIYIATAVTQTVARRRTLTFFEMVQTALALLIGMGGVVWV